jgi:membrane-bound serine protease (ClpP class)
MKLGRLAVLFVLILGVSLLASSLGVARAQDGEQTDRRVVYIQAEGPVTPAMVSYVQRGVRIAQERNAAALIFRLDTPGGQVDLTQDIITALRESRTPVVVYVAPRGAAAWSAGTFITLAGHAAAMAPETSIGAASPVGLGEDLPDTSERKAKEGF